MRDKPFNQDLVEYVAKRMAMFSWSKTDTPNEWMTCWGGYTEDARNVLKARRDWKNDVDVTDNG